MKKIARFLVSVKKEMKKVRWPGKKELIQYSIATLIFIVLVALFFTSLDLILAGIKLILR